MSLLAYQEMEGTQKSAVLFIVSPLVSQWEECRDTERVNIDMGFRALSHSLNNIDGF